MRKTLHDIDRREFLDSVPFGAGAPLAQSTLAGPADVPSLVIDGHAHVYSDDEAAYPIIEKPYRPPAGRGTVAHVRQEMKANGVTRVTAIQTSTSAPNNTHLCQEGRP